MFKKKKCSLFLNVRWYQGHVKAKSSNSCYYSDLSNLSDMKQVLNWQASRSVDSYLVPCRFLSVSICKRFHVQPTVFLLSVLPFPVLRRPFLNFKESILTCGACSPFGRHEQRELRARWLRVITPCLWCNYHPDLRLLGPYRGAFARHTLAALS